MAKATKTATPAAAKAAAPAVKKETAFDHNSHINELIDYATQLEPGSAVLPSLTSMLEHVRVDINNLLK